ncbi:MAG: PIN domain-containing protein [Acidimicrobiia bacterium]|nr:PIN domain-containing protein [Acidimicrobiia bacterium]
MIFVDSNVPMYLIGGDHRNKNTARAVLQRLVSEGRRLVTDAEVYKEVLHRFGASARRDAIQRAFDLVDSMVDHVFTIEYADVVAAKDLLATHPALSARGAIHVATMRREGVRQVISFDLGFDSVAGIERLHTP